MANNKRTSMILASASLLLLNACTSNVISSGNVPESGLTVSELYHQSMEETNASWTAPHYRAKPADYEGYTRTAANEVHTLFKPLDNPSVPIFVYPHVALIGDEQLLKPGYTTAFFLYKQNQFALPSERY
jgi:conjugative transfer region lipoprotein (TIGR03751 family)